jgi:hypothetical protein
LAYSIEAQSASLDRIILCFGREGLWFVLCGRRYVCTATVRVVAVAVAGGGGGGGGDEVRSPQAIAAMHLLPSLTQTLTSCLALADVVCFTFFTLFELRLAVFAGSDDSVVAVDVLRLNLPRSSSVLRPCGLWFVFCDESGDE